MPTRLATALAIANPRVKLVQRDHAVLPRPDLVEARIDGVAFVVHVPTKRQAFTSPPYPLLLSLLALGEQ